MKVLMINVSCGTGSTGRICTENAASLIEKGNEVTIAYGRSCQQIDGIKTYKIGNISSLLFHVLLARVFDAAGLGSYFPTKKFIKWIKDYNPDLIQIHNLHGYYINIPLLFKYLKTLDTPIEWTLHDCWAFTGHCTHFSKVKCSKWKTHCISCIQKDRYPKSFLFDNSWRNYEIKKTVLVNLKKLTIITPSQWLANLVKCSFLKDYPIRVQHNKVDVSVFKPTESDFREKNNLTNSRIVLGVASVWDDRKGLYDFYQLAEKLEDPYKIVLVGLSNKQKQMAPDNIICIDKINDTKELAKIYSAADLFVNPSYEESFGLTTLEAMSCGTKVIVYKNTACEEIIKNGNGIAVDQNVDALYRSIINN